ncbi:uncharacterized protein F5147DRAFT_764471, partial [Suillus discolor]
MSHSYRDVFQTFPAYRMGSPPVTSDADRSLEFPRRPGSPYRPKLKCQSVSQTINARSDSDKETSSLPLVWVEVRDNVIPPHAVPFASDSHGPLFIARAYLEGAFFLGKAGPQLTSGAIISYGSLEITVVTATFEVVILLNDIPENAYNSADNHDEVDNNQRSATPDPDPAIVASHTRARSYSTYGLSSKESLDVDILKARDTFVPLKSPLELTERSRSLPPRARRSAESSFDARAELGAFRSEHAPVSRPSVVTSSKPRVHLDCTSQGSYRLPTVASAVEYSANERGTPVGSFGGSEITGFREVVNVDGRSAYSSSPREPPAQSVHAGFAQDVLPRRRYSNTGIAPSTPVNHHTNQFLSTSATSHSLASNVLDSRFTNTLNPSSKDDSQFTPTHYSFSSHKVSSDSPLSQPSTVFSRGTWAGTQGTLALCLCILDDVEDTSKHQSKLVNCPVHPPADTIGISGNLSDFGHVDQYDQWASPVAKTHVWQRGMQHQKSHLKDSPSHVPQSPTFLSTDSPPAQNSLVGDHTGIDLRSTHYSRHDVQRRPAETLSEDENTTVSEHVCGCESEHVCDSEHWQLVSRTTFGIEAQTCDGTGSDVIASELPAPITINPSNAGIVTSEVKLLPHPMPLITSASQVAGDSKREHSRGVVQESTLERELVQENRVAVTAVSQNISTGESTSVVSSRGTLVTEECAPLSTVTCSPSLPPSQQQPAQTISCNDGSVMDDELHKHRECADSSVIVCASVAHEENNSSTRVVAVESTQKTSPASNDIRNSSFIQSTLTIVESPSLTSNRHEELYDQDVARDKPSQVTPTPKLVDEREDCKRQTVEGREDSHDQGTESDVKQNLTSYSRTVRIVEGNTSKSTVLNDDRTINEGADGVALSLSNPGSKMYPSEPGVPQDSGINRIESGYEHQSLNLDTVSRNSIQISSHDSAKSSEEHIQRQSALNLSLRNEGREVDSSVLVQSSLIPAANIGTLAPAPRGAVENTRNSSLAYNDLRNSSSAESTCMTGQTSSLVIDLKDRSCGQIVGTKLPTQSFSTPNVYVDDRVLVSADCMRQDPQGRGGYHAREVESEATLNSESYSTAVESVRQSESAIILKAGGRSDKDANSDVSSLSSTYAEHKLSLSEPDVPQDGGINPIQSACEHQSSEINVASDDELYRHRECTDSSVIAYSSVAHGENDTSTRVITVESTQKTSPASNDIRNSSFAQSTSTIAESTSLAANRHEEPCDQDVARDKPSQISPTPKLQSETEDVFTDYKRQTMEGKEDHYDQGTASEVKQNLTSYSRTVKIIEGNTSKSAILDDDKRINESADGVALSLSSVNPGSKVSPSESDVPRDSGTNHIEFAYEHRLNIASKNSNQISNHDSSESSEGHIQRQSAQNLSFSKERFTDDKLNRSREDVDSSVLVRSSLVTAENIEAPASAPRRAVESTQKSILVYNDLENSSLPQGMWMMGQTSSVIDLKGGSCGQSVVGADLSTQSFSTANVYVEHDRVPVSTNCMPQGLEGRGGYHAREVESQVTFKSESYSSAVESVRQSESTMVLDAGGRSDKDANSNVSYLPSTYAERKLSSSESGLPQDAGINVTQSAHEHHSSDIDVASATSVQTLGHRAIENRVESSLVTIQEGPCFQYVAIDEPCQHLSAPKIDSNEPSECVHQAVESKGDRHELETESKFNLSLTADSHPVGIVERSTSKTVVSKIHGQTNQNTNVPPFSLSQMATLSPSDPGIPQDAEADLIQSGCEHQSSTGVDAASIDLVQTSNYDYSTETQGYRSAQLFSCSNVPGSTISTHVYLSLEQNNSNSPPSIDKAVENTQESSSVNGISKSLTSTTYQSHSLVASAHEESCGQDMTKDQPNQGSSSPKYEVDEEGVTADRMQQAIMELRCESQSDVNEVSKTFESEHTWSYHSPVNSEWHSQRQGDYHAREVESEVTLKSKPYFSAVESAIVFNAGGRSDEDAKSDISSLSSTYTERKLSLSEPGVPQDAGINFIQSGREHQTSKINVASKTFVRTSSHRSIENRVQSSLVTVQEGPWCQPRQCFSVRKLDINELPDSPKHEADEEGVTADRMHQAIVESRCERQSLDVNKVSKTFESEPTWIHHSLESGEWHTQRQGRQQVYSSGIVGPQVGESNTTPQFLNITVKNTHTSSTTPDDLWSSPVPEGTSAMEQTPPAGDSLQGAPDRNVTRVRYSSRSSSIPKFEDNNVDVSAGYMRQASVTRGDYHEQRMDSEVEQNLAYHFCSVGMLGRSTSDTVTANNDRRMDKDAEDTAFPLSSTTIRSKLSIAEPDILRDVATSSKVITTSTNSTQTSSYRSTVDNEHIYQQPAQTSSWSNESPVNQSQTTTPVHLFSVPGENNPTPAQPFSVASSKNTQQPNPAFNSPDSSLPEGPTTGQTSSSATYECGEPCGRDEARDLPSQGSSTPKLRDDKEDILAYCTFQGVEDHCLKAGPTVTSVTCDSITVQCSSQTKNQENTLCAADTRRCGALGTACDTCSTPSDDCTNTAPNDCPPADGQLTQTAAIDCAYNCPSTMDSK